MLKNIATVLSGTVVAQLIGLAAMPLLSRLYSPEDFGRFQIYMSSLNILLMVVAFRYEVGLLSATSETSFRNLLALVIRVSVVTSLATGLLAWALADLIGSRVDGIGPVLLLMAPAMLVAGFYQALTFVPIRDRAYRLSATSRLAQSGGYVASAISLALGPFSAVGLVIADLIGRISASVMIVASTRNLMANIFRPVKVESLARAAAENKKLPTLTFPGTLLSAITAAMPPVIFASVFSIEIAGQYALVERFILLPIGIVALAVGQVFTGDLSEATRERPLTVYRDFKRLIAILALIGLPGALAGFWLLPWFVPIAFGDQWGIAGQLAAWAMPMALCAFVAGPINMILLVTGHNTLQLAWEFGRFLLMVAMFVGLQRAESLTPEFSMAAIALVGLTSYAIFILASLIVLRKDDMKLRHQSQSETTG